MRLPKITIGLTAIALAISLALMTAPVYADRGPCSFLGATFTIQYFSDAGLTKTWSPFATDGTGMCPPNSAPVVNTGQTIYVKITVTGGLSGTTDLWYALDNGNFPWPSPVKIVPMGVGSGSTSITITAAMVAAVSPPSCTINEKVAFTNTVPVQSSWDGDSQLIDHLVLDHSCLGVPEFSLPVTALMLALVPIMFLFKRRKL